MPQRIQLRRTRGWRKPEGAVVVARPSRWGNLFRAGLVIDRVSMRQGIIIDVICQSSEHAVQCYRWWLNGTPYLIGGHELAPLPPTIAEIRGALAGHDLACWCPLVDEHGQRVPCHADVLLELANA